MANFGMEFFCNKTTLLYTSTKLSRMLCAIVGVNSYHTHRILWTWPPTTISFFSKLKKESMGQRYVDDNELTLFVEEFCGERGSASISRV